MLDTKPISLLTEGLLGVNSAVATKAGYTLEELLCCLEGKAVPETSDLTVILRQINHMPLSQVAQIVQAAAARLAAVAESAGDEVKAS